MRDAQVTAGSVRIPGCSPEASSAECRTALLLEAGAAHSTQAPLHPGSGSQASSGSQLKQRTSEGSLGQQRRGRKGWGYRKGRAAAAECLSSETPALGPPRWRRFLGLKRAALLKAGNPREMGSEATSCSDWFTLLLGCVTCSPGAVHLGAHLGCGTWEQRMGPLPRLLMAHVGVLKLQPIQGLLEVRHAIVLRDVPEDSDLFHEDLQK